MLFQVYHFQLPGMMWICIIPGALLLVFQNCSQVWHNLIKSVPLTPTLMAMCGSRCYIFVHLSGSRWSRLSHWYYLVEFLSFLVSHCFTQEWFCIISCTPLPFTVVAQCCFGCPTATHSGGLALSLVFHCWSYKSLCVISEVSLLLTGLALHLFSCPNTIHWSALAWSYVP